MIYLITGATHTGKTLLAQRLLEKYKYPYLSIDHLKMGLIRSGNTSLTPLSAESELTEYLWPIIKEIIKTAIENKQNLIVEGCYVPFDWDNCFEDEYLKEIKFYCIIMTEKYIRNNFKIIKKYANVIEQRLSGDITIDELIEDNQHKLGQAKKFNKNYILVDEEYDINV